MTSTKATKPEASPPTANPSDEEPKAQVARQRRPRPKKGALCSAHRTNGDPCNQYAIRGGSVCGAHGGRAPAVKAKAAERILAASDLAAKRLIEFMNDKRVPYAVRLSATKDLLDRAGVGGRQPVQVEVSLFEQLITGTGGTILYDLKTPEGDIVDAEVVDPEAEEREVAVEQERFAVMGRVHEDRESQRSRRVSLDPPGSSVPPSVPYSGDGRRPPRRGKGHQAW